MKKIAILFILAFSVYFVSAQNSKVQSAINYIKPQYNQLDKAKEAIDLAVKHEKTKEKAKAWKVRGQVYQTIATTKDEKFKNLCEKPLQIAYESYKKALELDVKHQYTKEITNQLTMLGILIVNKGIEYFSKNDFNEALNSFETSLEIDKLITPEKVDTMVIFNAGIAADRAKNYDKAIEYYQKTADLKYEGSKVYSFMANIELQRGDTTQYIDVIKRGIEAYPNDNDALMVTLINYYLEKDKSDLALEYLNKAIKKDPNNHTFYFARGALYDKLGDFDNAKTSYEKAIEIKPDYFDAFYNLGALFFNKGADMLKAANEIPPNEQAKYDAAVKKAFVELDKAVPYLEKAHEIDSKEKSTMLTLKEIYFKLRGNHDDYMNKYKKINEELKALGQ
jgi:tetratricopeptide (TPR) repeat protein